MAAGLLSAPGTTYGPCEPSCDHIDCARMREDAKRLCEICNEPIGYETRFYRDPADEANAWLWTHADCLEATMEAERQAVPS